MTEQSKIRSPKSRIVRFRRMCWRDGIGWFDDLGSRNADCGMRTGTMKRSWIHCFAGPHLNSAVRNLKATILSSAMLLAFGVSAQAQTIPKIPQIGLLIGSSPIQNLY
jgi:hypothetical protein